MCWKLCEGERRCAPHPIKPSREILVDIFDDEKHKLIDSLSERNIIADIRFTILCQAGKSGFGGVHILVDSPLG